MSLEEQIKQKKFKSQKEKALINISFTHSFLMGRFNQTFKPFNISMQQFNVLRILKGQHPQAVCINDIADRMVDKMSNASRLVEKLRLKGLVERKPCESDRRQVDINLTEEGLERLDELNMKLSGLHSEFDTLNEKEFNTLNDLLDRLRF